MTDRILPFLLIFLSVDIFALSALLIVRLRSERKRSKILHFGDKAEGIVSDYLKNEFPSGIVLNNVYLKNKRSSTQLDHILLCKWGIYVIETKSHNGQINTDSRQWVQIYGEKVVRFHSPLLQNKIHCEALRQALRNTKAFRDLPVKGLVVFTSKKVSFSHQPDGVLKLSQLGPYIKNGGKTKGKKTPITADPHRSYLSLKKLQTLEKIIEKHSVRSYRKKRDHRKLLRGLDRNRYEL